MNRRAMIVASLSVALTPRISLADTQPWQARFLTGGYDGRMFHAGLKVNLTEGWKTYWRVPGSGGVPPAITLTGENLAAFEVVYPVPERFSDETGETIGYKHEVVFPIMLLAKDPLKLLQLKASAFIGVCQTICIPVKVDSDIVADPSQSGSPDGMIIETWIAKSPKKNLDNNIGTVTAKQEGGGVVLVLQTQSTLDEVFADFLDGKTYLASAPVGIAGGYHIGVAGAKTLADLQGRRVRLTYLSQGKALEQVFVIS